MSYPAVIGLEVHVQLKTETKILCDYRFRPEPDPVRARQAFEEATEEAP